MNAVPKRCSAGQFEDAEVGSRVEEDETPADTRDDCGR